MSDEDFMRLALQLAEKGRGSTSPNPMVGAVIVKDGIIVGKGYHKAAGMAHAEVEAIKDAGEKTKDATLYVTLEPCNHYGKTPPCTDLILKSGIKKVVVAVKDPNPLATGGLKRLEEAGIEIKVGVLEEDAKRLNEAFFCYVTKKRPFVIWKAAMTLDGKIATATGDSRWVTSVSSRRLVHKLRSYVDAIVVGKGTLAADDPELTVREVESPKNPVRVILDSYLSSPLTLKVFNDQKAPTLVYATNNAPLTKKEALNAYGVEVVLTSKKEGRVNIREALDDLYNRRITSLLLESGGELAFSFWEEEVVDKIFLFIAPKIVGGRTAPTPVGGKGKEKMEDAFKISCWEWEKSGEDLLITAYPEKETF